MGRNQQAGEVVLDRLEPWLRETVDDGAGPVPVIGHSRGGQEARVLAVRHPDAMALLVTLGAPLRVLYPPHLVVRAPAAALQLAAWVRRSRPDLSGHERYEADRIAPFPSSVPFVSVYSRSDGFLDWRLSLDAAAEPVEIDSTHFGLAASVPAFEAIAHALERLDK